MLKDRSVGEVSYIQHLSVLFMNQAHNAYFVPSLPEFPSHDVCCV